MTAIKPAVASNGSMQVRLAAAAAAAALLEGPRQRAYLAIAEHREHVQLRWLECSSPLLIAWHYCHGCLAKSIQVSTCKAEYAQLRSLPLRKRAHLVCRGFTTLSAVLGKMAVSTHEALLQAMSCEADSAALTAVLRFAATLCGAAPYQRLPVSLLPRFLQASPQCPVCLANPSRH